MFCFFRHKTRVNSRIDCFTLAKKIWQVFHRPKPHTQLLIPLMHCFIAKKYCYNKKIINQNQIYLLSFNTFIQKMTTGSKNWKKTGACCLAFSSTYGESSPLTGVYWLTVAFIFPAATCFPFGLQQTVETKYIIYDIGATETRTKGKVSFHT